MQKLKYEKFNNSNDVIAIDLHNGYTVIAITGFNTENRVYTTTLFLKEGFFDCYIDRYEYESKCFDVGNDLAESERLNAS